MDPDRLAAIPLFAGLSPAELQTVSSLAHEHEIQAGQTVLSEGDFGHSIFAVEAGTGDVVSAGQTIGVVGPGQVIGEIAVLASGRRTASIVATSPMKLISLFKRDVWALEEQAPDVTLKLRTLLDERTAANGS